MQSTIHTATVSAMSFVPLNQGANLAPRERLIPLAAAATDPPKKRHPALTGIGTGSMVGRGEQATTPSQPSEKLTAIAKKRGI